MQQRRAEIGGGREGKGQGRTKFRRVSSMGRAGFYTHATSVLRREPGCSELSFRRTTLGFILPKDTCGLPPGETICRDISPYLVMACTQCAASEMGTVERKGHISDKTASASRVLIKSFKVFPARMARHLSQQFILSLALHQMAAICSRFPGKYHNIEQKTSKKLPLRHLFLSFY